jgi:hypothetical protein
VWEILHGIQILGTGDMKAAGVRGEARHGDRADLGRRMDTHRNSPKQTKPNRHNRDCFFAEKYYSPFRPLINRHALKKAQVFSRRGIPPSKVAPHNRSPLGALQNAFQISAGVVRKNRAKQIRLI